MLNSWGDQGEISCDAVGHSAAPPWHSPVHLKKNTKNPYQPSTMNSGMAKTSTSDETVNSLLMKIIKMNI